MKESLILQIYNFLQDPKIKPGDNVNICKLTIGLTSGTIMILSVFSFLLLFVVGMFDLVASFIGYLIYGQMIPFISEASFIVGVIFSTASLVFLLFVKIIKLKDSYEDKDFSNNVAICAYKSFKEKYCFIIKVK